MSKFNKIFAQAEEVSAIETEVKATSGKKRGRPQGKRSDPDYLQISAYIKKDTYTKIKIALLQSNSDLDFSELIESLLQDWLEKNNNK